MKNSRRITGIAIILIAIIVLLTQLRIIPQFYFPSLGLGTIFWGAISAIAFINGITTLDRNLTLFGFAFLILTFDGVLYDWPISTIVTLFITTLLSIGLSMAIGDQPLIKFRLNGLSNVKDNVIMSDSTRYVDLSDDAIEYISGTMCSMKLYFNNLEDFEDVKVLHLDLKMSSLKIYVPKTFIVQNDSRVVMSDVKGIHANATQAADIVLEGSVKLSDVTIIYI